MRTLRTIPEVRDALGPVRRAGRSIALVPTMGALHAGHLALIERARRDCDEVVVSLFVNPAQFGDPGDLAAYPRDEERDAAAAAAAGADVLFAPDPEELYPPGFATHVALEGPLAETLEGERRGPEHFRGVATVVVKLLNIVQPDVAVFGQKDAQQALVVRRVVADLDLPVRIDVAPTVRDADGLALSSRNARLAEHDRPRAVALSAALTAATAAHRAGERDAAALERAARAAMTPFAVEPEYLALVDPESLAPVAPVEDRVLAVVAATVGGVRLIDNQLIGTLGPERRQP
jgi:pantoate--beta-alanine ligase